jgi:hypothetical protein
MLFVLYQAVCSRESEQPPGRIDNGAYQLATQYVSYWSNKLYGVFHGEPHTNWDILFSGEKPT